MGATPGKANSGRGGQASKAAAARQLVFPADAVTRDIFLDDRPGGAGCRDGEPRRVLASARTGSTARYSIWGTQGAGMAFSDLLVMSAVAAIVQGSGPGPARFTLADVARRLGYANPHAPGMSRTVDSVAATLRRLSGARVELSAVAGEGGRPWLGAVPPSPVVSCVPLGDYRGASTRFEAVPPDPARPLSALPLLARADEAGQVIGVAPRQMPDFSGRRVSLAQRQMAIYLTVRALGRLPRSKVLLDTLMRAGGVRFPEGGAGRQARARALRQLVRTLDAMSEQGAVIGGYELERDGGRVRAVVLQPIKAGKQSGINFR